MEHHTADVLEDDQNSIRCRKILGDGERRSRYPNASFIGEFRDELFTTIEDLDDKKSNGDITIKIEYLDNELCNFREVVKANRTATEPKPSPCKNDLEVGERRKVAKKPRRIKSNPQPTVLSTIEIDQMFKNYRKLKHRGRCGRKCDCYYCSLLNYPSEDDSDDGDVDIGVAYGVVHSEQYNYTRKSESELRRSEDSGHSSNCCGDQIHLQPLQGQCRREQEKDDQKRRIRNDRMNRMNLDVRNFEKVLSDTRQLSMEDACFDLITSVLEWTWSIIQRFWNFILQRNRRQVFPELPLFKIYDDHDLIRNSLHSVEVIK